ncbi:MAG: hypothetical protein RL701_2207 [Pseudomonadota bacterium]
MRMNNIRGSWSVLAVWLAFGAWSCSGAVSDPEPFPPGYLAIRLQSGSSVQVRSVTYQLTRPDGFVRTGPIAVAEAAAQDSFGFRLDDLQPSDAYVLTLFSEAWLTEAKAPTSCRGRAEFGISAAKRTSVAITLQCDGVSRTGSEDPEDGQPNECPALLALRAWPDSASVGQDVQLWADVADDGKGPGLLTFAWAAAGVTFGVNTGETKFRCTFSGAAAVSVSVSDGDGACAGAKALVWVTCTDPVCLAARNCATLPFDRTHAGAGGAASPIASAGGMTGGLGSAGTAAVSGIAVANSAGRSAIVTAAGSGAGGSGGMKGHAGAVGHAGAAGYAGKTVGSAGRAGEPGSVRPDPGLGPVIDVDVDNTDAGVQPLPPWPVDAGFDFGVEVDVGVWIQTWGGDKPQERKRGQRNADGGGAANGGAGGTAP